MSYTVKVQEFEGPLELLLNLIEDKKLSINEVSLGEVTDGYFGYLNAVKDSKNTGYHTEIAAFLVIAATLMLIKSKSLLPGFEVTKEEEEDIKELEERLAMYEEIRKFSQSLKDRFLARRTMHARSVRIEQNIIAFSPPDDMSVDYMLGLIKNMLEALPPKNVLPETTVKKVISVEEKIKELEQRISKGAIKSFTDFVGSKKEKSEVIVSFLAMLELVKLGIIAARQSKPFELIKIDKT